PSSRAVAAIQYFFTLPKYRRTTADCRIGRVRKKEFAVNKIRSVVGIAVLSAAVLPLAAQEGRPFSQIMKEVNGSVGEVKKAFEGGNKEAVASGGQKLEALFKEVEVFFAQKST